MSKYISIYLLFLIFFIAPSAYSQVKVDSHQLKIIKGTVTQTDFVGNIISVLTNDQQQMAFYVPGTASITQQTRDIGLMDIRISDPLIIQYYISSQDKYTVVSIVDNKPTAVE